MVRMMDGLVRCGLLVALSVLITGCAERLYREPSISNPEILSDALKDVENPLLNDLPMPANLRALYRPGRSSGPFERALIRHWGQAIGDDLTQLHIRSYFRSQYGGCWSIPLNERMVLCRLEKVRLMLVPGGLSPVRERRIAGGGSFYVDFLMLFNGTEDNARLQSFSLIPWNAGLHDRLVQHGIVSTIPGVPVEPSEEN